MHKHLIIVFISAALMFAVTFSRVYASEDVSEIKNQLEQLQKQVDELKQKLEEVQTDTQAAIADSNEWKNTTSSTHLAGYGTAGFTDKENEDGSFDVVTFNPIIHFQYKDRVLMEAELEFEIEEDGETETVLEYSTIDYFLNDYFALVGGKFLSPIGQFRQNVHPSWINKLPAAPPGFDHDGAAPQAEIGLQLRGGAPLGQSHVNYALYIGNGPELEAEEGIIHGVASDGFTRDEDGGKVIGGRIGYLPIPHLELGLSLATGDVTITEEDGTDVEDDPERDYDVYGADFAYQWKSADLRGEYVQQDVGDKSSSTIPDGGKWESWYLQASQKFWRNQYEGVLRYADFDSPVAESEQEQWAIGLNYLIAPQAIAKLSYEFNDSVSSSSNDDNRWLFQMTYGY
jgi:outer membrane murein-binding lipoprotein Lpp